MLMWLYQISIMMTSELFATDIQHRWNINHKFHNNVANIRLLSTVSKDRIILVIRRGVLIYLIFFVLQIVEHKLIQQLVFPLLIRSIGFFILHKSVVLMFTLFFTYCFVTMHGVHLLSLFTRITVQFLGKARMKENSHVNSRSFYVCIFWWNFVFMRIISLLIVLSFWIFQDFLHIYFIKIRITFCYKN